LAPFLVDTGVRPMDRTDENGEAPMDDSAKDEDAEADEADEAAESGEGTDPTGDRVVGENDCAGDDTFWSMASS